MAKYASFLKPWSRTAHIKREWFEKYFVLQLQARMTSNLVLQALKQKYALHRNMKYGIREIHLVLTPLEQKSPFQVRMTWFILRFSSHLVKTALRAEKLDAAYVKYASFQTVQFTAHSGRIQIYIPAGIFAKAQFQILIEIPSPLFLVGVGFSFY